jgi:hypothetical protein
MNRPCFRGENEPDSMSVSTLLLYLSEPLRENFNPIEKGGCFQSPVKEEIR